MKKLLPLTVALASANFVHALPVDWHGEFQVDTNRIEEFTRSETPQTDTSGNDGSQQISKAAGQKDNASFQTYIFKLQPEIIVNDSTTLKAELTSGYGKGGRLGEQPTKRQNGGYNNALFTYNTNSENDLNLTQAYAIFYADTATYKIGRHTTHWGLGAVQNSGDEMGSRHSSTRDGITVDFKIGNFDISPYYSKVSSEENLTKAARVKESGISLLYNNKDQELSFGLLYAKNKASNHTGITEDIDGTSRELGIAEVKITDIYFKKTLGKFTVEAEVPLLTGNLGNLYDTNETAKYKAKAFLFHTSYVANNNHTFKVNFGQVSGDGGNTSSYDAMYLNPNYQVANLLFRYNLSAIADKNQNIHDSYVHNATFFKASHIYDAGAWNWENSFVWAKADEVAKANSVSYNHTKNKNFTANADQEDDLGFELDSNIKYQWNTSVTIGGNFGYLFTGDYFAFNNTTEKNTVKDSYVLKAFANIKF